MAELRKLLTKAKVDFAGGREIYDLGDLLKLVFSVLFLQFSHGMIVTISKNYSLYEPIYPLSAFVERIN